jgi:hypothetical protein
MGKRKFYKCESRQHIHIFMQRRAGAWIWIGFAGDIFGLHEELSSKGATIKMPPQNFSWAMEMHVTDPDAHVLRFGTDPDCEKPFLDREE